MNRKSEENTLEITVEALLRILDYSSDEIFVLDRDQRIVYVNRTCEKHYGLKPSDIIGKLNFELFNKGYWKPSIVPEVYETKIPCYMKQETYIGTELMTSAIPILNEKNEIELVVITASELQRYKMLKNVDSVNQNQQEPVMALRKIIANCEKMEKTLEFCKKIAGTDSTVLILGESGTGKGVLAQHIHQISNRKNQPFMNINCAAIPEELLESELFGYKEGAFTGAKSSGNEGLIAAADGGTLFLDEIGEMPLSIQAKLLQVIQDKEFIPLGSNETRKVDIRIITATNQNLLEMVQEKKFREDLFYRLNVVDIHLPPLKERKEDIIPLTYSFLNKFNQKYNENKVISKECLDILIQYDWPGNVRQLENLMERLVVISDSIIQVDDLPDLIKDSVGPIPKLLQATTLDKALSDTTRILVRKAYIEHGSSRKVASELSISQTKASRLIREYCRDLIG
ncbi:sigma-54 interaction domain-containing protein [Siminovitchia fordii]|uniref:Diguanylate cyclase n=1 Tax=Siminovitchia fordii TaxID=254759 RepID=A0ABQ4K222_9BACI|nr:sigma 54-interacting transcriptional regulator [Siminovitchia fordii]GIN19808.1 diguanylate cyclase [Siminovitchia fordii]